MSPYYPIEKLRKVPGFERAIIVDPYAGGKGNSIRYLSVARKDNYMRVVGLENLFVGGEKSGFYVGHTEAICTGTLAGHNAARNSIGMYLLQLPTSIALGDYIAYTNEEMKKPTAETSKFTFAGSVYLNRMKELGFYTIDKKEVENRIKKSGLEGIFNKKIIK